MASNPSGRSTIVSTSIPTRAAGSACGDGDGDAVGVGDRDGGDGNLRGFASGEELGRPFGSGTMAQVGRVDRGLSCVEPEPSGCLLGGDSAPELMGALPLVASTEASTAARSCGPSWICSSTSRQTGRPMSAGGSSQTALAASIGPLPGPVELRALRRARNREAGA